MTDEETHQERLHWTGGWSPEPLWPREPNIDTVRLLARRHLIEELPATLADALLDVRFFAQGGFNKLYRISCTGHCPSYLLRAALPIVPCHKTESEVATIAFLRANTTIPVPRILAWDSNQDNELTFEWILMEQLAGVPLFDLWPRKVPWPRKLELTQTVAGMIKQLREYKFDRIGGLYFKSAAAHENFEPKGTPEPKTSVESCLMPEPVDDPVTQATHEIVDELVDELMMEPVDERVDEGVDELVMELVNEVIGSLEDEAITKLANRPLIAGLEAAHTEAGDIAIPSVLQSPHLDAQSTADAHSQITDVEFIVNDNHYESKQSVSCDYVGDNIFQGAGITGPTAIRCLEGSEVKTFAGSANQAEFSIGPAFDHLFFMGSRLYLQGDRGPFVSSFEWLNAQIRIQLEWIKNGPVKDDDQYFEEFAEESPMMESMCREFLDILPTVCVDEDKPASFILHHHDLNEANILVDPETFEVTGIVDWEMINVVPEWRAADAPRFLDYMEPDYEEEPLIPSDDVNENDISWELRDRWEHNILRRRFDEIVKGVAQTDDNNSGDSMAAKAKRDCQEEIPNLTAMWTWSEMWLKKYKTTGKSVSRADITHTTYVSDDKA